MKVIQSWIPYKNPNNFTLEKNEAYMMMLSSLLLKKHYGSVTLYTNQIQKTWFEKIGFEFDYDTKILQDETSDVFSMSKLTIMKSISEPFIHYDLDTLVFEKPNLNRKTPYIFSNPDVAFATKKLDITNGEDVMKSAEFKIIYDNYLEFYFQNKDSLENIKGFPHNEIKLSEIPNMNIISVTDGISEFNKSIDEVLVIYKKLKKEFDKKRIYATFLEQFLINFYLKKNNPQYKKIIEEYSCDLIPIQESPYLFTNIPVEIKNENLDKWPLKFMNTQYCTKCLQEHNYVTEFESIEKLKNNFDFNFLSYYHLGGDKPFPLVNAMIISHLIKNFGEDKVIKIHNFYKNLLGTKQYISLGEKLYEEITGNTIFTNLNKKSIF